MIGLILCAIFGGLALAAASLARRRMPPRSARALAIAFVVLAALTVVFDSLMIASGLFDYGAGTITGVRLWLAPIEDLAYPFVSLLVVATVLALTRKKSEGGSS